MVYAWVINADSLIHRHADHYKIKHMSVQQLTSAANRSMPPSAVKFITAVAKIPTLTNMNPLLAYQTVLELVYYMYHWR